MPAKATIRYRPRARHSEDELMLIAFLSHAGTIDAGFHLTEFGSPSVCTEPPNKGKPNESID